MQSIDSNKGNEIISSKTPAERYLEHLDNIFQQDPEFFSNKSLSAGLPGVTAIVYRDVPDKGHITALTYGLSLVKHPDWKYGRAELCISVESSNLDWGRVVAIVANTLRGDCPFAYGQSVDFEGKIAEDSEMDAFFIFAPSTLDENDYLSIDIGTDYKINIAGLYPIYSSELAVFEKIGLEAFWHHPKYDNYSVNREKITN